jgi:hypothetical protein
MLMNQTPRPKTTRWLMLALTCALVIAPSAWSQTKASTPTETTTPRTVPVEPTGRKADEDQVVLSPFVVSTQKDQGYFSANTLAGSRMNTNLADLGSSISVITKQQMDDTASTDINDIFRYEVNTEGSLTYTPGTQSFRNDGVLDVNAGGTQGNSVASLTNSGANRVRGLGSPSAAINYYPSIGSVPFDAYNTQTVEVSRGPNSLLFGLGSPAGIVNQSTAQAQLNRQNASVSFRTDQYGSFRSSFNFNKGLIEDKLAIYGAAVYDDRRFDRDPSYDKTKRFYGAITFKPFKKTTIKVNAEKYDNDSRRPNTLTPRDFVTQWNLAGQPYYDPVTRKITSLATGKQLSTLVNNSLNTTFANDTRNFIRSLPGYNPALRGTSATAFNGTDANFTFYNGQAIFGDAILGNSTGYVAGKTPSSNVLFVPGIGQVNQARSIMQIADGQLVNWFQPTFQYKYLPNFGTPTNPAANPTTYPSDTAVYANPTWSDVFNRGYTSSTGWTATGNGIYGPSYKYPSVTDSSIYDWRSINLNSMNFGSAKNRNYNVELEQELPGNLFLSAGWFRQDFAQRTNFTVAQLNVSTLYVDTNKNLPDGTANPYFGKPYLEDQDPDSYYNAEIDDHYRAMLAWTPDFTQKDGWRKWLGHHQVLGLWSRDEYMATSIRQRLQYLSTTSDAGRYRYLRNPNKNHDGTPSGWNRQTTSLRRTFYLASPGDPNGVVTQSAGTWDYMNYTNDIKVYDYDTNGFRTVNLTTGFDDFDGGTGRNQRVIDSLSGGITSYLWNERLIATFGVRKDEYKARVTNTGLPAILDANKNVIAPAITNAQKWVNGEFQRDFLFNRWGPYGEMSGTTRTLGGVLRPFQGWSPIERRASDGSQFWQFVRSFGFSYNQSDNFNPPSNALGDFYGNQLAKPVGEGKDFGIQFSLFDNKLFARITRFEASNENENIAAPVVFGRLSSNIDETLFRNWARTIALINTGRDPTVTGFGDGLSAAEETAIQTEAAKIWKLPYDYYSTSPFARGATRNADATGIEAEINYNPTRNWTMKFTFGKQDTKYASVLKEFTPWNDDRMAVWTTAKASDYLLPQYQNRVTYVTNGGTGRQVDLTNFWSSYGYNSAVFPEQNNAFANPQANYNGVVAPQLALDRDLQGQSVQGQRKYRWSFLTSYTFTEGFLKDFTFGGNERWEDKAVIGYAGKASGVNLYNGVPVLDYSDVTRPYYDSAQYYTDVWISYRRPILNNKVRMKVQLNVSNVFESGSLRPVLVNFDGTPYSYRIIDPRLFTLTTSFDF